MLPLRSTMGMAAGWGLNISLLMSGVAGNKSGILLEYKNSGKY